MKRKLLFGTVLLVSLGTGALFWQRSVDQRPRVSPPLFLTEPETFEIQQLVIGSLRPEFFRSPSLRSFRSLPKEWSFWVRARVFDIGPGLVPSIIGKLESPRIGEPFAVKLLINRDSTNGPLRYVRRIASGWEIAGRGTWQAP